MTYDQTMTEGGYVLGYPPRDMSEVIEANQRAGFHFFDPATLRSFGSRIGKTLYGGRYFVTSEQDRPFTTSSGGVIAAWNGQRRYTVREAKPDGSIHSDTFGEFETRAQAIAAIRKLLA